MFWWYGPSNIPGRRFEYREDPLELARVRLARGEITLEEFEEIKKVILNS